MQITIDSSESLSHVTTVIGAMYGVELVVAEPGGGDPAPAAPAGDTDRGHSRASARPDAAARRRQAAINASKAARRTGRGGPKVDASVVRQWAAGQGMTVSNRGQLPKAVVAAYEQAHGA